MVNNNRHTSPFCLNPFGKIVHVIGINVGQILNQYLGGIFGVKPISFPGSHSCVP